MCHPKLDHLINPNEKKLEHAFPQGVLNQNWGETELNRSVTSQITGQWHKGENISATLQSQVLGPKPDLTKDCKAITLGLRPKNPKRYGGCKGNLCAVWKYSLSHSRALAWGWDKRGDKPLTTPKDVLRQKIGVEPNQTILSLAWSSKLWLTSDQCRLKLISGPGRRRSIAQDPRKIWLSPCLSGPRPLSARPNIQWISLHCGKCKKTSTLPRWIS
ncbi:hypothetical protein TNCV_1507301 [Trichonephila clavipes]|nr:hypothetical protein TNCV_1507301 [Trichonephila clavipes]